MAAVFFLEALHFLKSCVIFSQAQYSKAKAIMPPSVPKIAANIIIVVESTFDTCDHPEKVVLAKVDYLPV